VVTDVTDCWLDFSIAIATFLLRPSLHRLLHKRLSAGEFSAPVQIARVLISHTSPHACLVKALTILTAAGCQIPGKVTSQQGCTASACWHEACMLPTCGARKRTYATERGKRVQAQQRV